MKSLLRTALENANADTPEEIEGPTITMTGPLSHVFSRALSMALSKDKPITEVATETAAMDVTVQAAALREMIGSELDGYEYIDAHAATMSDIKEEDVEEVQDAIDKKDSATQYVLIVDATDGLDGDTERFIGLESYVTSHGGLVYVLK